MTRADRRWLGALTLFYTAASLLHFAHNAQYVGDYPNLPLWLTRGSVYLAWLCLAGIGLAGWLLLYRSRWHRTGLCVLGLYAALGFDGLLHYTRAPVAAHTLAMNFTIWFEALAAAILLVTILIHAARRSGAAPPAPAAPSR